MFQLHAQKPSIVWKRMLKSPLKEKALAVTPCADVLVIQEPRVALENVFADTGIMFTIEYSDCLFNRQYLVRPTSFLKPVKKEVGRFMIARCG